MTSFTKMKLTLVLLFFVFIQTTHSQGSVNPLRKRLKQASSHGAVHVRISEGGLNYAANIAADILVDQVAKKKIDDISGKKKVRYWVKDIKIDSFRKPTPKISMIPGNGMKVRFENSALEASGRWRWKKAFVSDSGKVKAWVNTLNIELSVNIVADSNGKPSLKAHSCNADLGGFNVKLSGGASFLYNLIFSAFKGNVRKNLEKNICSSALDAINDDGNKKMADLNLYAKVGKDLMLDYHLSASPIFAGTYLETVHKGVFLEDTQKPQIPLIAAPMSGMVGFSIAEEAFNSASRVAFKKKILEKELNLPSLKTYIKTFDSRFKDADILATISCVKPPRITITLDQLKVDIEAFVSLIGRMSDGKLLPIMELNLQLNASASVVLVEEKIVFQLKNVQPDVDVKKSFVGIVPRSFLNFFIEESLKLALPSINEKLAKGFPLLTVPKVKFSNASFKLLNGYLSLSSDVVYQP